MLRKKLPSKTVQNVWNEILAETASEKLTPKITVLNFCPKNVSEKTVVQIVRSDMLGEKRPERKLSLKLTVLKCCPKLYPQKRWVKISVPKS